MSNSSNGQAAEVIVYSTPLCAPCEQLKHYLKAHDVEFVVKDLMMDEDAADRLDDLGIRSTPALEVNGEVYAVDAYTLLIKDFIYDGNGDDTSDSNSSEKDPNSSEDDIDHNDDKVENEDNDTYKVAKNGQDFLYKENSKMEL